MRRNNEEVWGALVSPEPREAAGDVAAVNAPDDTRNFEWIAGSHHLVLGLGPFALVLACTPPNDDVAKALQILAESGGVEVYLVEAFGEMTEGSKGSLRVHWGDSLRVSANARQRLSLELRGSASNKEDPLSAAMQLGCMPGVGAIRALDVLSQCDDLKVLIVEAAGVLPSRGNGRLTVRTRKKITTVNPDSPGAIEDLTPPFSD